ncbi:hypothetical protein BDN71DRAFT_1348279, partial [Pleurotus eryngii]
NMANAVWSTMKIYGLVGRVIAIVMDNASNNNTLMEVLETHHRNEGYDSFSTKHAHLHCIPHTIHLAALKLLEGIGAITKTESTCAAGQGGDYQTTVSREEDDNAAVFMDATVDEYLHDDIISNCLKLICSQLRKIVWSVRSSLQQHKAWLEDVEFALCDAPSTANSTVPLMLILDVKT